MLKVAEIKYPPKGISVANYMISIKINYNIGINKTETILLTYSHNNFRKSKLLRRSEIEKYFLYPGSGIDESTLIANLQYNAKYNSFNPDTLVLCIYTKKTTSPDTDHIEHCEYVYISVAETEY